MVDYPIVQVTAEYEPRVGEIMQYIGEGLETDFLSHPMIPIEEFEKEVCYKLSIKARAEGQEPLYIKCEWKYSHDYIVNYKYFYNVTMQIKVWKASPIPWGLIVAVILVALAIWLVAKAVETFWTVIVEAGERLALALGLPKEAGVPLVIVIIMVVAVMVIFGVMSIIRR